MLHTCLHHVGDKCAFLTLACLQKCSSTREHIFVRKHLSEHEVVCIIGNPMSVHPRLQVTKQAFRCAVHGDASLTLPFSSLPPNFTGVLIWTTARIFTHHITANMQRLQVDTFEHYFISQPWHPECLNPCSPVLLHVQVQKSRKYVNFMLCNFGS